MISADKILELILNEVKSIANNKKELTKIYTIVKNICRTNKEICTSIKTISAVILEATKD